MTPEEEDIYRKRQKSRAVAMAIGLGALVVLFYLITIAKIGVAG